MNESTTMKKSSSLRYAFGMFGTSIPINMFKTYAAVFYIDRLGLITTPQWSLILLIYTFVDAIDNPVYGFLSDRTDHQPRPPHRADTAISPAVWTARGFRWNTAAAASAKPQHPKQRENPSASPQRSCLPVLCCG